MITIHVSRPTYQIINSHCYPALGLWINVAGLFSRSTVSSVYTALKLYTDVVYVHLVVNYMIHMKHASL